MTAEKIKAPQRGKISLKTEADIMSILESHKEPLMFHSSPMLQQSGLLSVMFYQNY